MASDFFRLWSEDPSEKKWRKRRTIPSPRWIPRLDRRFEERRFRATFEVPRLREQATFLRLEATFESVRHHRPCNDREGTELES